MTAAPRIAVLGAGAVGGFVGAAWHFAGLDVTMIGRGRIAADVAAHGVALTDLDGWRAQAPPRTIPFATDAAALAAADVVLLCVKSGGTEEAAAQIAAHAPPGATVVSLQNGVGMADLLRRLLPGFEIVQGMVPFNVAYLGDGRWHKGVAGDLTVEDCEAMRALAARVGGGPARLRLSRDMPAVAWGKLLLNLNNAVNALSGETLLAQLGRRDYRRVLAASMAEALALLKEAGIEPAKIGPIPPRLLPHAIAAPDFLFRNLLLRMQRIDAHARSSMQDDLAAGRATEIDYLNGEVGRLADRLGRDAPVNRAILDLVRAREAGSAAPIGAAALRARVLGR